MMYRVGQKIKPLLISQKIMLNRVHIKLVFVRFESKADSTTYIHIILIKYYEYDIIFD